MSSGNEIAVRAPMDLVEGAMSIQKVVKLRGLITEAMREAMQPGQHFGTIPGCGKKPTLLQPGAQLLATMFQLRPEYELFEEVPMAGHRAFRVVCRLFRGDFEVSQGVGYCSSLESKFRYKKDEGKAEPLGPVPGNYWEMKNREGGTIALEWLSKTVYEGKKVSVRKIDEAWTVVEITGEGEKSERIDITDTFNTVLKIAKKRSFVDATITATASNDFFTQDLEDIRENLDSHESEASEERRAEERDNVKPYPRDNAEAPVDGEHATITRWPDVKVHFGKNKGTRFGDLSEKSKKWYLDKFNEKQTKGERMSTDDRKLHAAACAWQAENAPHGFEKAGGAGDDLPMGQDDDTSPTGRLRELLRFEGIEGAAEAGFILWLFEEERISGEVTKLEEIPDELKEELTKGQLATLDAFKTWKESKA